MKNNDGDVGDKKQEVSIRGYYKNLATVLIITIVLFFVSCFAIILTQLDIIIRFFEYFEMSKQINQFVTEFIYKFDLTNLLAIFILSVAYFTFFEYVKNKRFVTSEEEEKDAKYYSFIQSFYAIFNFIIIVPLILYLFYVKFAVFEALIIASSYLFGKIILSRLIGYHRKIISNYDLISAFDVSSVVNGIGNMVKKSKHDLNIGITRLKNGDYSSSINLDEYQQHMPHLQKGGIWYVLANISLILKTIFALTFIVALFGLILDFNVLSIIYLELNLVSWYSIVSSVSYLPKRTVNIALNTGEIIKDVYVVEESSKGHIIVLNNKNKFVKIMIGSVTTIE